MAPKFSVVVPCYNRSASVLPTLISVREQTLGDFECLVVDDGSSDGEILAEVVASLDDVRFKYVRRENGGGGAARNTGIQEARGDFIAFLDSDDKFLPRKLEKAFLCLADGDTTVFYSQNFVQRAESYWIRPERAIRVGERVATYLFVENQFIQTSTIALPSWLAKQVLFDPSLRKGQDLDFCVRLEAAGAEFKMYAEPLSIWTDGSEIGRTSRVSGYIEPEVWLNRTSHLLTPREILGYRATSLAYYYGWEKPGKAAVALIGGLRAGVPVKVIARNAARTFLPRQLYRNVVDKVVSAFGSSSAEAVQQEATK